jgi:hypothetical protein
VVRPAPPVYRPNVQAPAAQQALQLRRFMPPALARFPGVLQRAEMDKHDKQNLIAARAIKSTSLGQTAVYGNERLDLNALKSDQFAKKLSGYGSRESSELINETIGVPIKITELNAEILLDPAAVGFAGLLPAQKLAAAQQLCELIQVSLGGSLREPHVNREYNTTTGQWAAPDPSRSLPDVGHTDPLVANSNDPVKWAWWYYASNTDSSGWEKLQRSKHLPANVVIARPHTPQFAEIGLGGFVPRVLYDWWNNRFYATPHYNQVIAKDLTNPYVALEGATNWTWTDLK